MNGNNQYHAGPLSEQVIRAGIELVSARAAERGQAHFSPLELACHLSKDTVSRRAEIHRQVWAHLTAMVRAGDLIQIEDDFVTLDYFILPEYAAVTA
jgi:hypothetical protein